MRADPLDRNAESPVTRFRWQTSRRAIANAATAPQGCPARSQASRWPILWISARCAAVNGKSAGPCFTTSSNASLMIQAAFTRILRQSADGCDGRIYASTSVRVMVSNQVRLSAQSPCRSCSKHPWIPCPTSSGNCARNCKPSTGAVITCAPIIPTASPCLSSPGRMCRMGLFRSMPSFIASFTKKMSQQDKKRVCADVRRYICWIWRAEYVTVSDAENTADSALADSIHEP